MSELQRNSRIAIATADVEEAIERLFDANPRSMQVERLAKILENEGFRLWRIERAEQQKKQQTSNESKAK